MSFFTKIFFFVGETAANVVPKPLILDRWTTNAFFALRGQSIGTEGMRERFTVPSRKSFSKYKTISLKIGVAIQSKAYMEYVTLMKAWAAQLDVAPSQLEKFVFAVDQRRDKSLSNHRKELLDIIGEKILPSAFMTNLV